MKILVTGGSGFLGTHIREYFDADDFSRRSDLDVLKLHDAQIAGDYDVVIHLAATLDKSPDSAEEVFLTNVEGTVNLLRSMKKDSVFIFASTKDVYGRFADNFAEVPENCQTVYSGQTALEWSKLIAEKYVEFYSNQNNFRSCIFRLSTIYAPITEGNMPNFVTHYADSINKGEPIVFAGEGKSVRDILYIEDFARACQAFINSIIRHGLYNLGGGRENAHSLRGLVKKMEEISGYQAVIDEKTFLPNPVPMNYVTDLKLIKQELDWDVKFNTEEGLKKLF